MKMKKIMFILIMLCILSTPTFAVKNPSAVYCEEMGYQYEKVMKSVDEAKKLREWLFRELNKFNGIEAFPSHANFILFKTEKPYEEIYDALISNGIIVSKQIEIVGKESFLRVTVAPKPMLKRFLNALKEAIK